MRRMPVGKIVERLFANAAGSVFRRRRTRIERRMGFALLRLLARGLTVADAGSGPGA
jgi:hypothetical protein